MANNDGNKDTNKTAVKQPVIQVIQDDAVGYCDPVTGICTVPSANTADGKTTSKPETVAADSDKQLSK